MGSQRRGQAWGHPVGLCRSREDWRGAEAGRALPGGGSVSRWAAQAWARVFREAARGGLGSGSRVGRVVTCEGL